MMTRMKELEAENSRLKKMYAEERLKADILKEALEKSGKAVAAQGIGARDGGKTPNFQYAFPVSYSGLARRLIAIKPGFRMIMSRLQPGCCVLPKISGIGDSACVSSTFAT